MNTRNVLLKMNKKALTLTEVLIALSIGIAIFLPTIAMFSNSTKGLEQTSNLGFAGGLARYIIQGMNAMEFGEIEKIEKPGISCCDKSESNKYFKNLFNLQNDCGDLKKGKITIDKEKCKKLYNRLAKNDYRYFIDVSYDPSATMKGIKSVTVNITWKEYGENKIFISHAFIVQK